MIDILIFLVCSFLVFAWLVAMIDILVFLVCGFLVFAWLVAWRVEYIKLKENG